MQRRSQVVLGPCGCPCLALTWHVDHATVAVLHDVAGLTVNPTGSDAVNRKEVESHLRGPALAPRRGQVCELQDRKEGAAISPRASALTGPVAHSFTYAVNRPLLSIYYMTTSIPLTSQAFYFWLQYQFSYLIFFYNLLINADLLKVSYTGHIFPLPQFVISHLSAAEK